MSGFFGGSGGPSSIDAQAITPSSVTTTGNIISGGTANSFGQQGGTNSTLYVDYGSGGGIIQGRQTSGGTFNTGRIQFAGSAGPFIDSQASGSWVTLQNNGNDIVRIRPASLDLQTGIGLTLNNVTLIDSSRNATFVGVAASANVTSSGGKLGYAAGAGGTVTQATSKATAVTLNKSSGQITLNNAALASAAIVSFTFNNSQIAVADELEVWVSSGNATPGTYVASVEGNGSGTRTIVVKNQSAGSLSEAIVIGFAVRSAVTA